MKNPFVSVALAGCFLATTGTSSAIIVLNDPFTDGSAVGGADNSGINWFNRSVNSNLSVNSTAATTLTGNALNLNLVANGTTAGTGVKNRGFVGVMSSTFTPTEVGQYISLSFDFQIRATRNNTTSGSPPATFNTSPESSASGLTFGFYNSNNTPHTATDTAGSDNDKGFRADIGTGTVAGTALYREFNTAAGGLGTTDSTDSTAITAGGATPVAINDFLKHNALLTMTLTSLGQYTISLQVDGSTVATGTSATTDLTSFDEIAFSQAAGNNFSIDNVVVTIVPEISSLLLGGMGALALLRRRR